MISPPCGMWRLHGPSRFPPRSGFRFPFFIVAHLNDPMTGGYLVHRMYLKNKRLRDLGWMITYMPSGSRWMDTYLGAAR